MNPGRLQIEVKLTTAENGHDGVSPIRRWNSTVFCTPPGTRTRNPVIKSHLLYPLS